jgi:hypothetical protein
MIYDSKEERRQRRWNNYGHCKRTSLPSQGSQSGLCFVTLCPEVVLAVLADISNPSCSKGRSSVDTSSHSPLLLLTQRLVARLLDNLEIADLNTRNGKVGNLKLDIDGCPPIQQIF